MGSKVNDQEKSGLEAQDDAEEILEIDPAEILERIEKLESEFERLNSLSVAFGKQLDSCADEIRTIVEALDALAD